MRGLRDTHACNSALRLFGPRWTPRQRQADPEAYRASVFRSWVRSFLERVAGHRSAGFFARSAIRRLAPEDARIFIDVDVPNFAETALRDVERRGLTVRYR